MRIWHTYFLIVQVWRMSGFWARIHNAFSAATSAIEAIFMLVETLPAEQKQFFAAILWSLWKHKNLKVTEDVTEVAATVVERARVMLTDWQIANIYLPIASSAVTAVQSPRAASHSTETSLSVISHTVWKKSTPSRYKCNVDAAFSSTSNRTGIDI